MKVAVVAPAATVTVPGTVTLLLLLDKVTTTPLEPAADARVTVPVAEPPPVTDPGETEMLESAGGLTVRVAD